MSAEEAAEGDAGSYVYYDYDDYASLSSPSLEQAIAAGISTYTGPALLLLGTGGNLLSLAVMARLGSRGVLSTCVYLSLLAAMDLLVLYTRCGNEWLLSVAGTDLSHRLMVTSDVICKLYPFLFNLMFHAARWLLVATAIEGLIATRYPRHAAAMVTLSRAQAVIMLLIVLLVCVNIHYFWSFELVLFSVAGDTKTYFCTFAKIGHQHSEMFQQHLWPVLDLLVAEVLPYVLVTACGGLMLKHLLQGTHRGDKEQQAWRARYELHAAARDELKVTVVVLCGAFLILTVPKFMFRVSSHLAGGEGLREEQRDLALAVCATLEYMFLSLKFLIYFCTSRRFKEEFFRLARSCLCCCCRKLRAIRSSKKMRDVRGNGKHLEADNVPRMTHIPHPHIPHIPHTPHTPDTPHIPHMPHIPYTPDCARNNGSHEFVFAAGPDLVSDVESMPWERAWERHDLFATHTHAIYLPPQSTENVTSSTPRHMMAGSREWGGECCVTPDSELWDFPPPPPPPRGYTEAGHGDRHGVGYGGTEHGAGHGGAGHGAADCECGREEVAALILTTV